MKVRSISANSARSRNAMRPIPSSAVLIGSGSARERMPTPPLREVVDEVEDLAKVAADPVQGVHDDRVARPGGGEHLLQALAVGGRSPEDEFSTPRIRVLHQERWLLASLGKAAEAVGGLIELAAASGRAGEPGYTGAAKIRLETSNSPVSQSYRRSGKSGGNFSRTTGTP
jgi:hypothetical protein